MFCSKCGAKIEKDQKFCPKCGQRVTDIKDSKAEPPKEELKEEIKHEIIKEETEKEQLKEEIKQELGQAPQNNGCLSCIYGLFIFFAIGGVIAAFGSGANSSVITGLSIFSFIFFFLGIWGLATSGRQNRIRTIGLTTPISAEEKKKRDRNGWLVFDIFALIATFCGVGYSNDVGNQNGEIIWGVLLLISVIAFGFLIWPTIINLIKFFREHPWKAGIYSFLIIVIPVILIAAIYSSVQDQAVSKFATFQDAFSSVLQAKYLGDDIVAGKSSADFAGVKTSTAAGLSAMGKITSPDDYETKIIAWAGTIDKAAGSKKTWTGLTDPPVDLKMASDNSMTQKQIQASLDRIAATKDYGDWAIATGDKDTMRSIAAELETENVYLSNLDLALSRQLNRDFAERLVNPVEAASMHTVSGVCKKSGCGTGIKKKLPGLIKSARNYSVGEPDAAKEWGENWSDLSSIMKINNGYDIPKTGVIPGEAPAGAVSPMEQAFNDECKAKGGTTGGAGGVKDRLPTTLTAGGLNCDYKDNGHTCWDTMTRIGQRFMGGENGCPEQGLLPKPAPTPKTPALTWNGDYPITSSQGKCTYSTKYGIAGGYLDSLMTPSTGDIIVSGNKALGSYEIDADGRASGGINGSASIGGSSAANNGTYTFQFTRDANGVAHVTGTMSISQTSSVGIGANCSQPFSGTRK